MSANSKSEKKPEPVRIQKVNPYPINCKFETSEGKPPIEGLIQRLEETGFIFRSVGHFFRVGESYKCELEIPVTKQLVSQPVRVMKTTESSEAYVPGGSKQRVMTVEVHFKEQFGEFKKPIKEFIKKIGQKPLPKPGLKAATPATAPKIKS